MATTKRPRTNPAGPPPAAPGRAGAPRQDRATRTRLVIIERAAEVFARHGYEGASLNDIIRATGLTKGAFYFHFASKEALALAVFRAKQQQLVSRLRDESAADTDAVTALRTLLTVRARLIEEDASLGCFLRLASELAGRFGPGSEFAASYETPIGVFTDLVRRGQRQGVFRRGLDARAAAETVFAALLGTDEISKATSGGADLGRRTAAWLEVILAGLAPPAPPARPAAARSRTRRAALSHPKTTRR